MPKTRHELDRNAKVAQLLDVAERLFKERGYSGTTTAAVAQAAGVAQNALYWYFPSKDALFVAVHERELTGLVRDMAKVSHRPLVDQVLFIIDRLEETQALGGALSDRARHSPVVAGFRDRTRSTLRATLLDAIRGGVPSGDREMIADVMLAIADGTHGMPKQARRRLVSFAVNRLVAPGD